MEQDRTAEAEVTIVQSIFFEREADLQGWEKIVMADQVVVVRKVL
jgi:hypothetical protein